jgi:hypothetical protein
MDNLAPQKFGIYSPVMGEREDFPNILLQNAFTPDNMNVQIWDGELRACKMRAPDMFRVGFKVASVSSADDTLTISGDYASRFLSTDSVVLYNSTSGTTFALSADAVYSSGTSLTTIYLSGNLLDTTPAAFIANTSNVMNTVRTSADFLQSTTPDGMEILRYHTFISQQGDQRTCAFTAQHVYNWSFTAGEWNPIFSSDQTCSGWSTDVHNGYLCATNNVDIPIYWDGNLANSMSGISSASGIAYASGDYIVSAEFIISYENYLMVGNVTYASGVSRGRNYVHWSSIGLGVESGSDWDVGGSGDAGAALVEGAGDITGGFGIYKGLLIIFKSKSARKMWFTGGDLVFEQANVNTSVGCSAPGSIINDEEGDLYYYGSDHSFREINRGRISGPINKTARGINSAFLYKIRSHYIDEYDEVWWSVPYGPEAESNNLTLVYKKSESSGIQDAWMERSMGVSAFGKYAQSETDDYTWDTLPWNTWEDWPWDSWDNAIDSNKDFPIEICAGTSGDTYRVNSGYLDAGVQSDKYFVLSTDLANFLMTYKRLQKMYVYARSEGGCTFTIYTISDNTGYLVNDSGSDWINQGTISIPSGGELERIELPVDIRARHFLIKVSAANDFSFVGMEFDYVFDGDE